jgi:hypothetical protein
MVDIYQNFGGNCYLHLQGETAAEIGRREQGWDMSGVN